jgi:CheY-like chemotaxis protein
MQGYVCQGVGNGSEALKAIKADHFDLVISDNQMPVMTGLQMLQCLAERPEDQRPPVIVLTGHFTDELHTEALKTGACAVLQKPYKNQDLLAEITRVLESR